MWERNQERGTRLATNRGRSAFGAGRPGKLTGKAVHSVQANRTLQTSPQTHPPRAVLGRRGHEGEPIKERSDEGASVNGKTPLSEGKAWERGNGRGR